MNQYERIREALPIFAAVYVLLSVVQFQAASRPPGHGSAVNDGSIAGLRSHMLELARMEGGKGYLFPGN